MRIVKYALFIVLCGALIWRQAGRADEFDLDALLGDLDVEIEQPGEAPAAEPMDNNDNDDASGSWDDDLFGDAAEDTGAEVEQRDPVPVQEVDDPADDFDWGDEPVAIEPVLEFEEEDTPRVEPATAPSEEDAFVFPWDEEEADEATPPAPAAEVAAEPAPVDDFDWDVMDFGEDPAPSEAVVDTAPAPTAPPTDIFDAFDDDFFGVEAPAAAPDQVPSVVEDTDPDFMDEADKMEEVAAPSDVTPVAARERAALEEVRRQANHVSGLKALDAGFKALSDEKYDVARTQFEQALRDLMDRPADQDLRERARWGLSESLYRLAQNIYRADGNLVTARQHLDRALELDPGHRGVTFLQRRIARAEARTIEIAQRPIPVVERADIVEKRDTVESMLREGREYFDEGEYDRAEVLFENVLIRDEYNTTAMRFLRRISERKYRVSTIEREATHARMIQEVRDAWNPPKRPAALALDEIDADRRVDMVSPSQRLQEKMERITIPRIEFRGANIRDVITFLRDASETNDPDGEGVNIILNLSRPGETEAAPAPQPTTAAADDDLWGDWGAAPTTAPAAPAFPTEAAGPTQTISLNLRRISLMEAIRYITEVAGLSYRIEDNVVVITPAGLARGPILTRLYPVQPSILDVIADREGDAAPATTGFGTFQGGGFGETRRPPAGGSGRRSEIREFFVNAGVPFPQGTSITYNPTISQLIVANTANNLERFERILAQLNVIPSQVEIEARFVEVAQDDLNELGLQWIFTDNYIFAQRPGLAPIGGQERIQVDASSQGVTGGMRFFSTSDSGVNPVSRSMVSEPSYIGDILSISSVLTNPEMRVVLHALSQKGNMDLLSVPRITTRSGMNASIEVVNEIIYPTEFRVSEPQTRGGAAGGGTVVTTPPTVTPENFQMRRTGVILNVTPTVGPDGYTIDLALTPEVVELVDWLQYGSSFRVPDPDDPSGFQEFVFNIPQPVFASRSVDTSIVIWDGQTVVMGGLMREAVVRVQDKIPLLGDIPLIGRLFRTEGTKSRKENLIIFVTARLVDPAGKTIQREDLGVPAEQP